MTPAPDRVRASLRRIERGESLRLALRRASEGCLAALLLAAAALPASGMHQPVRIYTTADGLPGDTVSALALDARGHLLVGGDGALAIFDGSSFTTLGPADGLPPGRIETILRTRGGTLWIGTTGALLRLEPGGGRRFTSVEIGAAGNRVLALAEDNHDRLWVGTDTGLWRLEAGGAMPHLSGPLGGLNAEVNHLAVGADGGIWAATSEGLARIDPDGRAAPARYRRGLPEAYLTSVLIDHRGRIWAGTRTMGLCRLPTDPDRAGGNVCDRLFTSRDGLLSDWIRALFESSDGVLNVGTGGGLSRYLGPEAEARGEPAFRPLSAPQGMPSGAVDALAEDGDRNLWLGTEDAGAVKLVTGGMVSFGIADGLSARPIASIFEDSEGALYVMTVDATVRDLNRLDGDRFTAVRPRVPSSIQYLGWGYQQISFRDRSGIWWIATGKGLCRYPTGIPFEALARTLPERVYTRRDGLAGDNIFRLYEDRRGDIWIGTIGEGEDGLAVWRRQTGRIENHTGAGAFPAMAPTSFAEERDGALWIGLYPGGLVRIADPAARAGKVEVIQAADGLPARHVSRLLVDRKNRLWVATSGGLACLADTKQRPPRFHTWTRSTGLAADAVSGIEEDADGRLYLATAAGVTRLEPETGRVRRYTTADGLPRAFVGVSHRDRDGNLWFGTRDGLARLAPADEPPVAPPPILIRAVALAGEPESLSVMGERRVEGLKLRSGQNRIRIEFGSIGFRAGESLAFQYRLDGAGAWSPPSPDRSVLFDGLSPGQHRFEVRAMSTEGVASRAPAVVTFAVQPPLWRQPWFLAAAFLLLMTALYLWHRLREARAVAIERVRTHIATDLHDDIGATLSQIAILNEVALARLGGDGHASRPLLQSAAQSARELVDTMGDIVWSVDPRRDRMEEVVGRMRRLAEEVCAARGIRLEFEAPENGDRRLDPSTRRQLYLVFKESLNNALRHSGCRTIKVTLRTMARAIELAVADDGRGFDPSRAREGNGLASMRTRARSIGGSLELRSHPGDGTEIRFTTPF